MAEAFGIAAAVGIATAFTACVDCFEYIQFGRRNALVLVLPAGAKPLIS